MEEDLNETVGDVKAHFHSEQQVAVCGHRGTKDYMRRVAVQR
jgi:hypothetical protein